MDFTIEFYVSASGQCPVREFLLELREPVIETISQP